MNPACVSVGLWLGAAWAVALFAWAPSVAAGAGDSGDADGPGFVEGPIRTSACNGGTVARRYLTGRGAENLALWVHDDTKVVRGVYLELHNACTTYSTYVQDYARTLDFAVLGMLIRWKDYERVVPDQLAKLAQALGHPEIANVPWACLGGSRNVGALLQFCRLDPDSGDRILALLFDGGPGAGIGLGDPDDVKRFAGVPILAVNGSNDPFVGQMAWQHKVYPSIRRHNLPYGVAVDWGCGHAPEEGWEMWWPFVKAAYAARVPADAEAAKGRVRLRPMRYEDGWLIGPVDWKDQWGPKAAPVAKWRQPPKGTVWLPNEACTKIWRAFVNPQTAATVMCEAGTLRLGAVPAGGFASVEYFADGEPLGKADKAPFALAPGKLASGGYTVWAECATPDAKRLRTNTVLVAGGNKLSHLAGQEAVRLADSPLFKVDIPERLKEVVRTLRARRQGEGMAWKAVFEDDFDKGIKPAWYNYYQPEPGKPPSRGHEEDKHLNVDGTMQLAGKLHAIAMLPYDWPRDLAVEYRCRAMSEKVCDLSVVMSGNPSGTAFPWRSGMMYQFGAHWNQGSFFLIHEQPHRNWKEYDGGARIVPGKWHTVRVERLDGKAKAWIDGKLYNTREVTEADFQGFYGQKVGLYTFSSTARFDDLKVFVRAPKDPASHKPPAPPDGDLAGLAAALVKQLGSCYHDESDSAWRLMRENSFELADHLRGLAEAGKVPEGRPCERVQLIIAGKRPG